MTRNFQKKVLVIYAIQKSIKSRLVFKCPAFTRGKNNRMVTNMRSAYLRFLGSKNHVENRPKSRLNLSYQVIEGFMNCPRVACV